MTPFTIINARILTLDGPSEPRRGDALRDLGIIEHGWIGVADGVISGVGEGDPPSSEEAIFDSGGRLVMPTFIDCHTHACWAGNRLDDFEQSQEGATYLEILDGGGGIMSTVRDVRDASETTLTEHLMGLLSAMSSLGTGAVEVKSGYGLTTEDELKMLRAIHTASQQTDQIIVGTFLGAHAMDHTQDDFVNEMILSTLPAVVSEFPGITCDAYCEQGAWSVEDVRRLLEMAAGLGCPLRVHADQFHSLGMTPLAIEMGAVSVDHLEATTQEDLRTLATSDTIGVALPASGFSLDDRYAPMRTFIDLGGAPAIATNCNPGSAPSPSMPFTVALACRKISMTPAEAITAATHNAACVLGLQGRTGSIVKGHRADLQVIDCDDERVLGYAFAMPGPLLVVCAGEVVQYTSDTPLPEA